MSRYILVGVGAVAGAGIGFLFNLVIMGAVIGAAIGLAFAYYSKR